MSLSRQIPLNFSAWNLPKHDVLWRAPTLAIDIRAAQSAALFFGKSSCASVYVQSVITREKVIKSESERRSFSTFCARLRASNIFGCVINHEQEQAELFCSRFLDFVITNLLRGIAVKEKRPKGDFSTAKATR